MDEASWRLEVTGLVADKRRWTLAELRAMQQHDQVTRHICVEGWSAIGKWGGVRFSDFLARVGADFLTLRGERIGVGKLTIGPAELRAIRTEVPNAVYQSGPKELVLRVKEGASMRVALDLVDAIVASRSAA